MKKKTKFGLVLAAVAAGTFYLVHRFAGKKPATATPPAHVSPPDSHVATAPAPAPHGSTVTKPNPATPADPFAPLPGQVDPGIHFDQPGAAPSAAAQYVDTVPAAPSDASSNIHFDQPGDPPADS